MFMLDGIIGTLPRPLEILDIGARLEERPRYATLVERDAATIIAVEPPITADLIKLDIHGAESHGFSISGKGLGKRGNTAGSQRGGRERSGPTTGMPSEG